MICMSVLGFNQTLYSERELMILKVAEKSLIDGNILVMFHIGS